jgi:hypothetical protein
MINCTISIYIMNVAEVYRCQVVQFDFSDEEIVTYDINFLKSLLFKLYSRTILFFYNSCADQRL